MADGKIYITISETRGGGANPHPTPIPGENREDKNMLGDFIQHRFFNLVENQAKQAVNYTISNIGNFTGDYITQTHVSDAIRIMSGLASIGMSAWAGFRVGGGVGALVAIGVDVAGKVITAGEQIYAGYVQNVRQNKAIAQLRSRAGLNDTHNGSRGTEN